MKYIKSDTLNKMIENNEEKMIFDAEAMYSMQIDSITNQLLEIKKTRPVVLLSGPSGSGKTSTANLIAANLMKHGCEACVISLDNYFKSNSTPDMPLDEKGNIDLESPYCMDLPLFQKHLNLIHEKKEFMMPVFDFKTQKRASFVPFRRNHKSVVILEGIHALNPLVTGNSDEFTTCIYVSVRTRIKSPENKMLHPRLIRLSRRLCRDCLFRGRNIEDVFRYFESVSNGEDKYILPYKNRAFFNVDTFMDYELPVYKSILYDNMKNSAEKLGTNKNYNNIMYFLDHIKSLDKKFIPENSMIREFVGS